MSNINKAFSIPGPGRDQMIEIFISGFSSSSSDTLCWPPNKHNSRNLCKTLRILLTLLKLCYLTILYQTLYYTRHKCTFKLDINLSSFRRSYNRIGLTFFGRAATWYRLTRDLSILETRERGRGLRHIKCRGRDKCDKCWHRHSQTWISDVCEGEGSSERGYNELKEDEYDDFFWKETTNNNINTWFYLFEE